MTGYIILGLFIIFICILFLRAFLFKPPKAVLPAMENADADEKSINRFVQLLKCKTVSSINPALAEISEFEKFRQLLKELYPNVHRICIPENIGPSGLLYTIKGKSNAAPVVLMSHYDVVPADEESWEKPPFEGILENGVLWGRGTLDTKGTLWGIMEAAENLISKGFIPENDLYFAFSGDEEIAGDTAPEMAEEFLRRGIKPAMVLDEGGAVVQDIFPGVSVPCALIGTAEKGMLDLELVFESKGGHASTPPPHTSVGILAQAAVNIENKPFKPKLTKPVSEMFDTLGRHSSFIYKMIFSNLWCFFPVLNFISRKRGGELNAMMRTTCALTMMEGSKATNILPASAKIRANLRLIGGDTCESAVKYLKSAVKNSDIQFNIIKTMNPSLFSVTSGPGWENLTKAIRQTWPDALISPYLLFACSDSRHYCRISNGVYRFSAITLSKEERAAIHGHNERISIENAIKIVQFYMRLMRKL